MESYGFWSLAPPVIAIVAALLTRQVLPALFLSLWVGATFVSGGNPLLGFSHMISEYIAGSIADPWNASIITYCLTLGGMIGIISKSGGITALADRLAVRAKSPRSGQLATALLGLVIFFDDYANTVLVGNTMRPLTDKLRISREKLAYIVDSTAAPIASMALVSTWAAYEIGIIRGVFETLNIGMNTYEAFLRSIPYRFYSIAALAFVFLVIILGRDFGPMLAAERRARSEGKLTADNAHPLATRELTEMNIKEGIALRWYNAVIPVFTVALMVIAGLYIHGYREILGGSDSALADRIRLHPFSVSSIRDIIGNANAAIAMMWAAFTGTIVASALVVSQRLLSLRETVEAWIDGAKSFLIAVIILVLAWGIGSLCRDLGTAEFLVGLLAGKVWVGFVPVLVFLFGCGIAFATGTSYGTIAILMPIALPLCYHLGGGETGSVFFATIGAVFTGAVFGDHCSPISDTTIMSSMASASDHIDHVKTQIPYALTVAAIAILTGFLPSALNINPVFSILAALVIVYLVIRYRGKQTDAGTL